MGQGHTAHNLWKSQNDLQLSRFETYKEIFEGILTEVFYQKSMLDESVIATPDQCFLHREIPAATHMRAQPFYDRNECVKHIIKSFREQGFFCKSTHKETQVFVSWYPRHLTNNVDPTPAPTPRPHLSEVNTSRVIKRNPNSSVSSGSTLNPAKQNFIELDGNQNSLQNRLKLSTWLLQQKQRENRGKSRK